MSQTQTSTHEKKQQQIPQKTKENPPHTNHSRTVTGNYWHLVVAQRMRGSAAAHPLHLYFIINKVYKSHNKFPQWLIQKHKLGIS